MSTGETWILVTNIKLRADEHVNFLIWEKMTFSLSNIATVNLILTFGKRKDGCGGQKGQK